MVSIRRRKLLGLCAGITATSVQLSASRDNTTVAASPDQIIKAATAHPSPSINFNEQKQADISEVNLGSFNVSGSSALKEEGSVPEVKCRKRYRRKHVEDQEPRTMRGVYFKNIKWQAAIKVDKKQIHLGTVGSPEEAAHLYDRAAFMCGREPNFELSEEEKQELRQFKWEEFLMMTRNAIISKKNQRRFGSGSRRMGTAQLPGDLEPDQDVRASSASDDMNSDKSIL